MHRLSDRNDMVAYMLLTFFTSFGKSHSTASWQRRKDNRETVAITIDKTQLSKAVAASYEI